jgi:hypothetical protein
MLPNMGTERFVSHSSPVALYLVFAVVSILSEFVFPSQPSCFLVIAVEVHPPRSGQGASLEEGDL